MTNRITARNQNIKHAGTDRISKPIAMLSGAAPYLGVLLEKIADGLQGDRDCLSLREAKVLGGRNRGERQRVGARGVVVYKKLRTEAA